MSFGLRGLLVATMMLFVAGCSHNKAAVPFDTSSTQSIKTIGLLTPGAPSEPSALLGATVGRSFGLIGMMVDAGMESSRNSDLKAMLNGQSYSAETVYLAGMKKMLEARGYKVVEISVSREKASELQKSYAGIGQNSVDAYLDTTFDYGYSSTSALGSAPYRPFIVVNCRLVKASDQSILMDDMVQYNPLAARKGHVTLQADPAYAFTNFDALMGDPKKAVEGLNVAFARTTGAVGELLE